jgi:hypothetical protein
MSYAIKTNKKTADGLTVYDLDPKAAELWAVAGPDGVDPKTIDSENLLEGFRWVTADEWEGFKDGEINDEQQGAFILVFRPHQRAAWAESFESDDEFVRGWQNGFYDRSCSANCDLTDEEQEATYKNAIRDCGHDLHCITRLDSSEEVEAYLESRQHNMARTDVFKEAKRLGWMIEDDEVCIDWADIIGGV